MNDQLLVAAVAIGAVWFVGRSVFRHNLTRCPRCKGTRKIRSSILSSRYRTCTRCGGAGEIRAWFGSK
ncbi:hypothetical protein [Streptosporangium minutum]|uniref:hypothetical protein n=1 Tax=Streptosporangium minutum TaxID=569862 RepID=UPI0010561B35|nr:hypothetical protein [Streptosporangium minutum]